MCSAPETEMGAYGEGVGHEVRRRSVPEVIVGVGERESESDGAREREREGERERERADTSADLLASRSMRYPCYQQSHAFFRC